MKILLNLCFPKSSKCIGIGRKKFTEIDDFTNIKGIGKGTGAIIEELIQTGESSQLKELEEEVPKGLIPLLKIPGLGGKKVAKLYQELGIDSAEKLKEACENKKVQTLPGFGAKTEEKILKEIRTIRK